MKNKYFTRSYNQKKFSQDGFSHRWLVALLVVSIVAGLGASQVFYSQAKPLPGAMKKDSRTFVQVGTYNIRSQRWDGEKGGLGDWAKRRSLVEARIKSKKPGIIGMQEVIQYNPDTRKYVSQRADVVRFMNKMGYGNYVGSRDNSSPIFWLNSNFKRASSGEYLISSPANSKRDSKPAARYLTYVRLTQVHHRENVLVLNYHFNQFENKADQLKKLSVAISTLHRKYPSDDIFFSGDWNGQGDDLIAYLNKNKVISLAYGDQNRGIEHVLISSKVASRGWYRVEPGKPAATDHPMVVANLTF